MSVKQRGKNYQVRWTNAAGKRCSRTFDKKALAEEYERKQRSLAQQGDVFDPSNARITISELYEPWLQTKNRLKPKTVHGYKSTWVNIVEPRWGKVQLRSITRASVNAWIAKCESRSGRSVGATKTREAFYILSMILDYAVDSELILKNPAKPREGSKEKFLPKVADSSNRNFLTTTELRAIAREAGHYRDLIILLGTLGLRFNEAVGLKGADVDLRKNCIYIRRTLSDVSGNIIEQPPKNNKTRKIHLPKYLRQYLIDRKLAAGADGYIFTSVEGCVIRHSNFYRRVWTPAKKRAGITKAITIHDLRGTAVSWLIDQGVNIIELSTMLGHSDPSITLKKYGHLYDENFLRLGQAIDDAGEEFA